MLDRSLDVPEISILVICHGPDAWLSTADRKRRSRPTELPKLYRTVINRLRENLGCVVISRRYERGGCIRDDNQPAAIRGMGDCTQQNTGET